uniref:Uncharacterized protein n=1 Tax=Cacopsylla melanoneura TaxID=428564 RepID=A0A8D9EW46_9HEMI
MSDQPVYSALLSAIPRAARARIIRWWDGYRRVKKIFYSSSTHLCKNQFVVNRSTSTYILGQIIKQDNHIEADSSIFKLNPQKILEFSFEFVKISHKILFC